MRIRKPSPAMAVAGVALFVALGGTSVAAIDYARKAGAVDGRSAVHAGVSLKKAAGKLVATRSKGEDRGKIPGKFLAGVARATSFDFYVPVADNGTGVPATLGTVAGVGSLSASCIDQRDAVGVEDPQTTFTFANTSGTNVSLATRVGGNNAQVVVSTPGSVETFTVNGNNAFEVMAQRGSQNVSFEGAVRQDGRNTADASCAVFGTVTVVG